MSQHRNDGPRVAPSRPKGSGRRGPRVLLLLIGVGVVALIISIVLAVLILRA